MIWFYDHRLSTFSQLDKKLLAQKLKEEDSKLEDIEMPSKASYTRDLKELLNYVPPYEQVKRFVLDNLKSINQKL